MSLRTDLAAHIRRVDGGNKLTPTEVGYEIALTLTVRPHRVDSANLIGFVKRVNWDKRMCPTMLAVAIVDHFNLEG